MPRINPSETALSNLEGIRPVAERETRPPIPEGWIPARSNLDQIYNPRTKKVSRLVSSAWTPTPGDFTFENVFACLDQATKQYQPISVLSAPTEDTAKFVASLVSDTLKVGVDYETTPLQDLERYPQTHDNWHIRVDGVPGVVVVGRIVESIWAAGSVAAYRAKLQREGGIA